MDPTEKYPVLPASLVAREKGAFLETVYRAIKSGAINGYKAGSTWLVMNDLKLEAWEPPPAGRPRVKQRRRAPGRAAASPEAGPRGPGEKARMKEQPPET